MIGDTKRRLDVQNQSIINLQGQVLKIYVQLAHIIKEIEAVKDEKTK